VGLAAAEKDVSRGGSIRNHPDTWMINCSTGYMYVGAKVKTKAFGWPEPIESQQIITIKWDQKGVSFLVDGVRRGEKHAWGKRPQGGVRVVAQLGWAGQSVSFAQKKINIIPGK
jgi:hypothetical protein